MRKAVKKAGLLAASMAAAAGAYYLYGSKDAATHRRKAATWMRRAEREIVYEAKKLKNAAFTERNYRRAIDMVAKKYKSMSNVDPEDVKRFIAAVQKSWEQAGKAVKSRTAHTTTRTKKIVRKGKQHAAKVIRRRLAR